eukprot:1928-Heterococcus_DN1.PRE.1
MKYTLCEVSSDVECTTIYTYATFTTASASAAGTAIAEMTTQRAASRTAAAIRVTVTVIISLLQSNPTQSRTRNSKIVYS